MAHYDPPIDEEYMDYLSIEFEASLDPEEKCLESVYLVGLLVADLEPSQIVVKEVLQNLWRKMGKVKVSRAKANVYSIEVGDETVAWQILKGNL